MQTIAMGLRHLGQKRISLRSEAEAKGCREMFIAPSHEWTEAHPIHGAGRDPASGSIAPIVNGGWSTLTTPSSGLIDGSQADPKADPEAAPKAAPKAGNGAFALQTGPPDARCGGQN
jgi:hypothetical protein